MATRLPGLCRHLWRLSAPAVRRSVVGVNRKATILWRVPLQQQTARLTRSICTATTPTPAEGPGLGAPHEVQQDCDPTVSTSSSSSSKVKENCVVRLRGLPFQATLKDVQGFLAGLNLVPGAIIFDVNAVGRRSGDATVALESAEQADLALKQRKHYRDRRFIEVHTATQKDILDLQGSMQESLPFVRMHGLPYEASEADIVEFFDPEAATREGEKGVYILLLPNGRPSGVAFAVFPSEEEIEKAMHKDRSNLGSRYVELYESSLKEFQTVLEHCGTAEQKSHFADMLGLKLSSSTSEAEGMRGRERTGVRLRGLPWSATADDVVNFFGDLQDDIVTGDIHIVLDFLNRPTGNCYVHMKSEAAAAAACKQLHKQYIEHRYIEVFQCTGNEVVRGLVDRGDPRGSAPFRSGTGGGRGDGRVRRGGDGVTVKCRGLPYTTTELAVAEFFQDYDVKDSDVELVYTSSGHCTGIAFVSFQSYDLAQAAVRQKHRQYIGERYVELSTI